MGQIANIVVALSIVAISGSAGVVLHFALNTSPIVAALSSLLLFTTIMHLRSMQTRHKERGDLDARIEDLTDAVSHCMRKVTSFQEQFDTLEETNHVRVKATAKVLREEIHLIESAIRELADTVDTTIVSLPPAGAAPIILSGMKPGAGQLTIGDELSLGDVEPARPDPVQAPEPAKAATPLAAEIEEPVADEVEDEAPVEPAPTMSDEEIQKRKRDVLSAIAANQIDVYLQPIVTLPQRKIAFYEATMRLRLKDEGLLTREEFGPIAEMAGVAGEMDQIALFRAVQLVRRLSGRGRNVGIVCNISRYAIAEPGFLKDAVSYLDTQQDLKELLTLELSYQAFTQLGPVDEEFLKSIMELGFTLSIDDVQSLKIDAIRLADFGIKTVKVNADLLLLRDQAKSADIHPADLAPLLARHGVSLIADGITSEKMVVDLLDYDIPLAQGDLFSTPRPVRADILGSSAPENGTSLALTG